MDLKPEDLYEAYRNGTSVKDIAEGVIEFAKENFCTIIPNGIDVTDYESVRENLGLTVIDAKTNSEYLESLVCEFIEGLVLVLIIFVKDKNSTGCMKIKKDLLIFWGVTASEVMEEAKENAPKIMMPTFRAMEDILREDSCPVSDDLSVPAETELFVVSNEFFVCGASVVFYPRLLESIRAALGTDFFVLPSSINEMLILRDVGQDPLMLLEIVKLVNRSEVKPEEVLADAVFYYSRSGGFRKILPMEAILE